MSHGSHDLFYVLHLDLSVRKDHLMLPYQVNEFSLFQQLIELMYKLIYELMDVMIDGSVWMSTFFFLLLQILYIQ